MAEPQSIKVSIFKRDNAQHWYMQYRCPDTGQKVRQSTGKTVRRDAERAAAKWEKELRDGTDHRWGRVAWEDFREIYEKQAVSGMAAKTAKKIEGVLNVYERLMNPQRLGNFHERAIAQYQQLLREAGRSENTIAGHLDHIKAMLSWAVDHRYLGAVPRIRRPRRAKTASREAAQPMKGRAICEEEFDRMLAAIPGVLESCWVTDKVDFNAAVESWRFYLQGLWTSGLRLGESLQLHWTDRSRLCIVDLDAKAPTMTIPAELEKGHTDREVPLAPEFVQLLRTVEHRRGFIFSPQTLRPSVERLGEQQATRMISRFGAAAGVIVNPKTKKMASAHDLRRSFGDRWAQRVMPAVLKELMRHESISTTMRFYVGRNATSTAEILWLASEKHAVGTNLGTSGRQRREKPR